MRFYKLLVLIVVFLYTSASYGQFIKSPYSNNGLGETLFQGLPNNFAMGEVGIGTPNPWHINLQNPSQLTYNKFSSFQAGISGDFRNYESATVKTKDNAASLRFLAMSFPVVANRWTTSFALLPLTSVSYNTYSQDSIDTGVLGVTQFQGDGGISQLVWSNGIRVYKTLAVGFKASYMFGHILRDARVQLLGEDFGSNYVISYKKETSYKDINFEASVSYRWILKETRFLNFGAVYELSNSLSGTENSYYERLRLTGTPLQSQTISENVKSDFTLPQSIGIGVSYEMLGKFTVGADVKTQSWKSSNEGSEISLRNTTNFGIGASFIPDFQSISNYLKRATYKVGISRKESPYLLEDTPINDFGINFGASFPVSGYSSMDLAFKFGQRGTTDKGLIKEEYFQVVIGATINDRWFIKRRYD
ncbi:MAG: hypothetical protein ACJAVY_000084 [Marinoscillum sp.]|jgi:hypothetical protein